jgi:predicted P-loop ATPase
MAAIGCPEIAGVRLAFDTFTGEASVSKVEEETWRKITDADVIELRVRLEEKCFKTVSAEMARDAMKGLLGRNRVDTAKTWANGLPAWDGVERISRFLVEYFQSEDTPYALSVGKYLWTALAGRLLQPGIKCDMVPIFVGDQGKRKSSGVLAMCPNPEAFTELSFHGNDDDTKRLLRGRLVIELAELAGMAKRDAEALKSFISARFDEWRPNYHEGMARYYRRGIFIGTSNRDDFLKDSTGHRRFLPINVGSVDVEAIERDRDQLWAEAIVMFNKNGVLYAAAEHAAKDEHAKFEQENPLAEKLEHLLKTGPFPIGGRQLWDEPYLKLASVMQLLAIEPKDMNRMRPEVANALQVLGYKKIRRRLSSGSNPASAWARASGTVHTP